MRFVLPFLLLALALPALAQQDGQLAQEYFQNGEYEKAAVLYDRLYKANEKNEFLFDKYVECLLALQQYEEADKAIRREQKKYPDRFQLYVQLGNLLETQGQSSQALEQYDKAIKKLGPDRVAIIKLAQSFTQLGKYDQAIGVYERGEDLLQEEYVFSYNLADLYRRKDDVPKMIESYLNSAANNPALLPTVKTLLQRYLSEEGYQELQSQLYTRIQEDSYADYYTDLLAWVFIQNKDYASALRQMKALDKRLREDGARVFDLAETAANDGDLETAIAAYDYIIAEKGPLSPFYIDAKRKNLFCKRTLIVEDYQYTPEELRGLETEYIQFLNEFGRNRNTAPMVIELAELEAFYLNDLSNAVHQLSELVATPGIHQNTLGEAKLLLGDLYLLTDERWEATLLYSQVDKMFEEDYLGHEARFRNAKLSYFFGDFDWAQAQCDVLKTSTAKLIANDALDLSVFILDNLGLDTTAESLQLYAQAELLTFQNRFTEAFEKLDDLLQRFPEHDLEDDVFFAKAEIYFRKKEYLQAADNWQTVVEKYKDGIRADNALYRLAELYENQLGDLEKAKGLYEKLFLDFSGSILAVEARKRYRILRGDNI